MSSWADEAESSFELAREAVAKLQKKNPGHPLLKYFILPSEDKGADGEPKDMTKEEAIRVEFKDRFWRRGDPWRATAGAIVVAVTYSNYWVALERALAGQDGDFEPEEIPTEPQPCPF